MTVKKVPFTEEQIKKIIEEHKTPFHIYDEAAIRRNAQEFNEEFGKLNGFREFFAVKALPNPHVLEILKEEGFGVDCSSMAELLLAEKVGFTGDMIMFTSNNTPAEEFQKAVELGAIINLDDISHIDFLEENVGLPKTVCFRYNPGATRSGNAIIGDPKEAKYGFTKEQLLTGYEKLKKKGVSKFGLHTMVISNELNEGYFIETSRMIFELVQEIEKKLGIKFAFVNLGGGIGIPYKPSDKAVSYKRVSKEILQAYEEFDMKVKVFMECGRVITGPYGYLVTTVRHLKDTHKKYVGLDATMADLMRPALYGAYHHITVMGKTGKEDIYDVTGSLCENNDKFAIDRKLPKIETGDIVVIHDTGAHGHAMGFNYNGKLRAAELLLKPDGSVRLIRRAETYEDLFATIVD